MILMRLPGNVKHVFEERLRAGFPLAAERVLARTREVRGGKLNDPNFGSRMRGEGEYAEAVRALFDSAAARAGLRTSREPLDHELVRPAPVRAPAQLDLFEPKG